MTDIIMAGPSTWNCRASSLTASRAMLAPPARAAMSRASERSAKRMAGLLWAGSRARLKNLAARARTSPAALCAYCSLYVSLSLRSSRVCSLAPGIGCLPSSSPADAGTAADAARRREITRRMQAPPGLDPAHPGMRSRYHPRIETAPGSTRGIPAIWDKSQELWTYIFSG
jgi:hypothetical protein